MLPYLLKEAATPLDRFLQIYVEREAARAARLVEAAAEDESRAASMLAPASDLEARASAS